MDSAGKDGMLLYLNNIKQRLREIADQYEEKKEKFGYIISWQSD